MTELPRAAGMTKSVSPEEASILPANCHPARRTTTATAATPHRQLLLACNASTTAAASA